MPLDIEVVGSSPAGSWAFFLHFYILLVVHHLLVPSRRCNTSFLYEICLAVQIEAKQASNALIDKKKIGEQQNRSSHLGRDD